MDSQIISVLKSMILLSAAILLLLIFFWFNQFDVSENHNEKCYRIGATYMTMNNPFYTVIDDEMKLLTESKGDMLITRDGVMSQKRQNREIESLLEEGIDLLIVNPVDASKVEPALKKAKKKHVPVIIVDTPVSDEDIVDCTIVSDNYNAGVLCAKDLMKKKKKANILLLEHQSAQSARDRIKGFCDTINENKDYKIVALKNTNGQLEQAMPKTSKALKYYKNIDVIMSLNDPSALGALGALEENNLSGQVLLYSVDGTPEAKNMIKEGMMTATSAQFVYQMADTLGSTAYDMLQHKKVDKNIVIPVQLITMENVDKYGTEGWQ